MTRVAIFGLVGFAAISNAASQEYFAAVMTSPTISSLADSGLDIVKIEQTGRLRCPGGYEFTVSLGDFPDVAKTVVMITEDREAGIEVSLAEY